MTISSTTTKAGPFAGNDLTTLFPFAFKLFTATDLRVVMTSTDGVESTLVLGSDYSVSLNADQNATPGGAVSYPLSGSPLATGEKLTLISNVPDLQSTNLTNGGGFFPAVINDALDKRTIVSHQNAEKLARAITVPVSDTAAPSLELPNVATRAGQFATYDADGSPSVAAGAASVPVSAAMTPVVAASTTSAALNALSRFYPVVNPSSGNIQGQGFANSHSLVYTDANTNFSADAINLQSTDPSALVSVQLGGSTWAGDVVTLHFIFNAQNIAVSYTVQSGNQLSDVAIGLANAIMANASLFQPVSANNTLGGGLPGQILYVIASGNFVHFDYDVRTPMTMTASVTGPGLTETVTLPSGGSPLPTALDANPVFALCRNAGVAPAAGSNIGQYGFFGTSSAAPGTISVQYGSVTCDILNSTSGTLAARVGILTCNPVSGSLDRGIFVSSGLYSPSAVQGDKGVDTANFKGYYIDGVNIKGNLPATATNDNASAGTVGEYVNASGGPTAMATLTVLNVTQISLTAGDWDVHGFAGFAPNAATTVQFLAASISTVSATLNNTPGSAEFQPCYGNTPGAFASPVSVSTGPVRLSLNATTTVYLVAQAQFGVNVMSVSGLLRARRVR